MYPLQPLQVQPEPVAVPLQNLDAVAGAVAENEQRPAEGILREVRLYLR